MARTAFDPMATMVEDYRKMAEDSLLLRLKPRYWFSRALIYFEVMFCLVFVSFFEDRSLTAQAIIRAGEFGWMILFAVHIACTWGLADVLVNDLMPVRIMWPHLLYLRHWTFVTIALGLTVIGVIVAVEVGWTWLLLAYWFNAGTAGTMLFMDAFARHRRGLP